MSTPYLDERRRLRSVFALTSLVAASGLTLGWFLPAEPSRTFDYLYALLAPSFAAVVCLQSLTSTTDRRYWLVPVFLGLVIVNIASQPHVPALRALSVAAGAGATLASFRDHRAGAMLGSLVACVAISASLLVGLARS